jgi:hypothetical protein
MPFVSFNMTGLNNNASMFDISNMVFRFWVDLPYKNSDGPKGLVAQKYDKR